MTIYETLMVMISFTNLIVSVITLSFTFSQTKK